MQLLLLKRFINLPKKCVRIETDPLRPMTEIMRIMSDLFGRDIDTDHEAPFRRR